MEDVPDELDNEGDERVLIDIDDEKVELNDDIMNFSNDKELTKDPLKKD